MFEPRTLALTSVWSIALTSVYDADYAAELCKICSSQKRV